MRRRDNAEEIRDKLEELRGKAASGAMDLTEHAHRSARLLKELERTMRKQHRYAKT
jgi:hypothetical protein